MTESSPGSHSFSIKVRLRHRRKLCPNCLSPLKPATFISGWLVPEEYLCQACGYVGHISLEASDTQKFKASEDKNEEVGT